MASSASLLAALRDPVKFSEVLCGSPLWDHQIAVARSPARYRVICSGRQAGKSRLLAVLSLHKAFTTPGCRVLVVSAGEIAAQRLLSEISSLAASKLLSPSLVDDTKSTVILSNGSMIMSVPASQKQIRGAAIDLLVLDEAGFIGNEIWRAAEPVIIARPDSRVIMCSSPWGSAEDFFRQLWQRGTDRPDVMYEAWHWPSSISPLVDDDLLDEIRKREGDAYFNREYLALWEEASGSFLTEAEISSAVAPYEMMTPAQAGALSPWSRELERRERHFTAVAGIDWGFARDANAVVLLAALDDGQLNHSRELRYFIPWMSAQFGTPYASFAGQVADATLGYGIRVAASEQNGVGAFPTQYLETEILRRGTGTHVAAVWTDARRKQSGFGQIKMMLQRNVLVLPSEPDLLRQLRALEFEQMPGGSVRITVPERSGHDDLAMALMQAVSCIRPCLAAEGEIPERAGLPHVTTPAGVKVPSQPRPVEWHAMSYAVPSGRQANPESGW